MLRDLTGRLYVTRWHRGEQKRIILPSHSGCRADGCEIVATFHTHPNTGPSFLQEPSATDIRAVRDDPDLKGAAYEGELIISEDRIYLVSPEGRVSTAGHTWDILADA